MKDMLKLIFTPSWVSNHRDIKYVHWIVNSKNKSTSKINAETQLNPYERSRHFHWSKTVRLNPARASPTEPSTHVSNSRSLLFYTYSTNDSADCATDSGCWRRQRPIDAVAHRPELITASSTDFPPSPAGRPPLYPPDPLLRHGRAGRSSPLWPRQGGGRPAPPAVRATCSILLGFVFCALCSAASAQAKRQTALWKMSRWAFFLASVFLFCLIELRPLDFFPFLSRRFWSQVVLWLCLDQVVKLLIVSLTFM